MIHFHSLDEVTGYVVTRTLGAKQWPARGDVLTSGFAADQYADALTVAREARTGGAYAIVQNTYGCTECDVATMSGEVR